jgi:4-amino-4-deoxy-L-arabinose transferase-like glycosyltransferase
MRSNLGLSRRVATMLAAFERRQDLIILLALAGLGLAVRLAFATRAPVFGTKDSFEYIQPAVSLLSGQGFDLALRRPPVYSLFAAGSMAVLGQNLAALALVQHLLGVLTVLLSYWLGRFLFGRFVGVLAGILVALDSVLIIYEHYALSESFFTLVLLGACMLMVVALRRHTTRWYVLAGVALGLAVLTRPVAQAVLLAVPLALVAQRKTFRAAIKPTLLVLGGTAILLVPWMVRNKLSHDSFSASGSGRFLSARVVKHDRGYTFYDPAEAQRYDSLGGRARQIFQEEAAARPEEGPIYSRFRSELGLSEAQADDLLRQISLEGIRRSPLHYVGTVWDMFKDLFAGDQKEELVRWHERERNEERLMNQWETGGMRQLLAPLSEAQQSEARTAEALGSIYRPTRWLTPLVCGMLLALAASFWSMRARGVVFLAAVVAIVLLVSAALVGEVPRYRYPLDPLISVMAVGGYWAACAKLLASRRPAGWRQAAGQLTAAR